MAKMIELTRDGQKIEVNADQIQWLEQNLPRKGTLIYNGDDRAHNRGAVTFHDRQIRANRPLQDTRDLI